MTNYNLNDSFQKLIGEMYFIYGGLRWEKTSAGFVHNGFLACDHNEMDLLVEQERHFLVNSIQSHKSKINHGKQ